MGVFSKMLQVLRKRIESRMLQKREIRRILQCFNPTANRKSLIPSKRLCQVRQRRSPLGFPVCGTQPLSRVSPRSLRSLVAEMIYLALPVFCRLIFECQKYSGCHECCTDGDPARPFHRLAPAFPRHLRTTSSRQAHGSRLSHFRRSLRW